MQNTHFHCCSKSYWPYWLARYYGRWFEPLITSFADFSLRNPILLISQCVKMNRWLLLHFTEIPHSPQFGSISSMCISASSIPKRHRHSFTVNFTMLKEQELFFVWGLLKKLTSSNCTFWSSNNNHFSQIDKSKELNYLRKISAWGDKWLIPPMKKTHIVKPIKMIYYKNGNGYDTTWVQWHKR